MLKNLQQMHLRLPQKKVIQETGEATGDLIGNTIADKVRKVLRTLPWNSSGTVTNETKNIARDRDIPVYILQEKRQQIIDDLRLI